MKGVSRLLFLTALVAIGRKPSFGLGAPIQSAFPLGTIGCLLSDVCAPGQKCKNDQLFGSCDSIKSISEGEFEFRLTTKQIEELEEEVWRLLKNGFTWKDAFTQCSLQNMLLAFAEGGTFDTRWCMEALSQSASYPDNVQEEIASVLQKLIDYQDMRRLQASADGLSPIDMDTLIPLSDKRDEFVNIHKYFDSSKGQYKRDPYMEDNYQDYLTPLMSAPPASDLRYSPEEQEGDTDDKMRQYLMALEQMAQTEQAEDANAGPDLRDYGNVDYVEETAAPEAVMEETPDVELQEVNYLPLKEEDMTNEMDAEAMDNNALANEAPVLPESSETVAYPVQETGAVEEVEEVVPDSKPLSISPPDEKTLENLLEGKVEAKTLGEQELRRLTKYVEAMVDTLETDQPAEETDGPAMAEDSDESPLASEVDMMPLSQSEASDVQPELVPMEKKAVSDDLEWDPDFEEKRSNVVKTRYANLEPSQPVSQAQAVDMVRALVSLPEFNKTVVDENTIMFENGKIVFEVLPNSYMNATELAEKANTDDVKTKLAQLTGVEVKSAGLGKEEQVALNKDNKYVVLTFILVGSIAGILLAVIVIYVVKQHTRSKKKLAQLSGNGEGNEASKDYQDLCRQRMQSKSSEKSEPLHAASRIGSVSESQVRSPSSRSSTSSWSEEPVASNMDISTGHIVLSYMEDHLKNQDRLDQEWDALCAYEADPCITAVAEDTSNTRKNRYGDILPYDHSRVVISTAANVSGSDYINANFITDHDPRNPAFISTQGPLPHTVADFWQMVWEQGSVVIVMLTKLTENGTAMCHRYWPEEGSDLYHIYEVHLVSEHIWCDDYLVRSFYLKNLQTNETRTVTQFHFLTWPNLAVPGSIKALLDFRRKVNKSYRGRSCPIVVHCSDGCGRTGTYCLIDMVLNRMAKGAKEIDMAATLEHIRDQRMAMVKTKEQFQFALAAVAEEVHAILKALPQ